MSNATIESPVAASQLFFAWSEQAEVGVAVANVARKASASRAVAQPQTAPPQSAETVRPSVAPTASAQQPQQSELTRSGHLSFTSDGRIAKPVRIGSVMIKLLKRYGITDAEIAEGVASYARKHQQAWAS